MIGDLLHEAARGIVILAAVIGMLGGLYAASVLTGGA